MQVSLTLQKFVLCHFAFTALMEVSRRSEVERCGLYESGDILRFMSFWLSEGFTGTLLLESGANHTGFFFFFFPILVKLFIFKMAQIKVTEDVLDDINLLFHHFSTQIIFLL